uniref:Uncharacterized protein n=1 Tax=Anguilla anguilla TaxID=7936 RepID=A0A0E9TCF7_ANGAN
MACAAVGVSLC